MFQILSSFQCLVYSKGCAMFLWKGRAYHGVENILGQINTNLQILDLID
jgi:hypothetical protein